MVELTIPKNGANLGASFDSTILPTSLRCEVGLAGYRMLAQESQVDVDEEVTYLKTALELGR
jgi:hypothetical protein